MQHASACISMQQLHELLLLPGGEKGFSYFRISRHRYFLRT
jgi:hypothetical protein